MDVRENDADDVPSGSLSGRALRCGRKYLGSTPNHPIYGGIMNTDIFLIVYNSATEYWINYSDWTQVCTIYTTETAWTI